MKRQLSISALVLTVALAAIPAQAEVRKEERNQVSFAGMLGKVFNLFGGKSAREGTVSSVAVSGDRKMTTSGDNTAQIVDLNEEKIYDVDLRRKTYKVTTFEQLRQRMREAEAKAREAAARESGSAKEQPQQTEGKEMEIDFDVKNTGQTKTINGFDTRQVVATIAVREKGKKLEESGGIVMTVDTWLTKTVSLKEIADFERRYYEKLLTGGANPAVDAQQMATAMAMFPGLKEAFARLGKEDFGGTAIQTTTTVDAVKSAEQMKQEASGSGSTASTNDNPNPLSVGGALGGFMRRRQQQKQADTAAASPNANPARSTFMTMNNEVLKIATNVTAADVAMPAGFKERN
ncbi:MAG: hypothetical protein EHM55_20795 [Acidobacteria bacterium]|nr:MAG: hypothetical protein EHM55_20795 [Acidobacteriota bacterium]